MMRNIYSAIMLGLAILAGGHVAAQDITVFAAASLRNVLDDVIDASPMSDRITVSYAGSSALARQIQMGAPADVYISANQAWVDWLQQQGATQTGTQAKIATNALVLIAPAQEKREFGQSDWARLPDFVGHDQMAMAMVDAVPAGIYGKMALEKLGIWDALADNIAQAPNVRAAMTWVALGEAPFGIVYATDAMSEPRVRIMSTFAPETHAPIIYSAVQVSPSQDAAAFLAFLSSKASREIFKSHGFGLP